MASAAVRLEEGEYDALQEALKEFTEFSRQIGACSRQDLKPHMERLESVQEDLRLLLAEMPTKAAVKLAADITKAPRNALYALALQWKGDGHSG